MGPLVYLTLFILFGLVRTTFRFKYWEQVVCLMRKKNVP